MNGSVANTTGVPLVRPKVRNGSGGGFASPDPSVTREMVLLGPTVVSNLRSCWLRIHFTDERLHPVVRVALQKKSFLVHTQIASQ